MKLSVLIMCVVVAGNLYGQDTPTEAPITLEELNRRSVIGKLGLPLGTTVEIEAEVVSGRSLRLKEYFSLYLLRVTHVNGKELETAPLMRFSSPSFASVELANHTFALYELKHGAKAKSLASSQIEKLEKGYVGKKVRLIVYEVGGFHGIPNQLPNDVPVWADAAFHFETTLSVLRSRETNPTTGNADR
jgi:hypothetical protein